MQESNTNKKHLIHCITNPIAMNLTANGVLALGASPIMAEHPKEVAEITSKASSLLLNFGNISDVRMEAMEIALEEANKKRIPVVLDICGVSCSTLRREFFSNLLQGRSVDVIKGNYSEVFALYDDTYDTLGVDAEKTAEEDKVKTAICFLAEKYNAIVLATGKVDLLAEPTRENVISEKTKQTDFVVGNCSMNANIWRQSKGSAQLAKVTATGCLLGAVIATFLAFENSVSSVKKAVRFFAECGEKAETKVGNGTFQMNLLDCLSHYEVERKNGI